MFFDIDLDSDLLISWFPVLPRDNGSKYHDVDLTIGEISTKINKSTASIYNSLEMPKKYGKNHNTGDNTKLTREDRLRIFKEIVIGNKRASEVTRILDFPVIAQRA